LYREMLTPSGERPIHVKNRVRISSTPTGYTFKIVNFPDCSPLLEGCPLNLLEHIDLKIVDKPVIIIESWARGVGSHNSAHHGEFKTVEWIIKCVKSFESEISWESPLISCLGVSESRFPFEGALLQIYNVLKPLFSTGLISRSKTWIVMEFPSDPEYQSSLDWVLNEMAGWFRFKPSIRAKAKSDLNFRGVFIGAFLSVPDLRRFSAIMEEGAILYDLEFYGLEEAYSEGIDLPIPLLEEV